MKGPGENTFLHLCKPVLELGDCSVNYLSYKHECLGFEHPVAM